LLNNTEEVLDKLKSDHTLVLASSDRPSFNRNYHTESESVISPDQAY